MKSSTFHAADRPLRINSYTFLGLLLPALGLGTMHCSAPDGATPKDEAPAQIRIMDIQGARGFSALFGQRVATSGVVTLIRADASGFWLQDPEGDGDPATSDGIYVSLGEDDAAPAVGDAVRIVAEVEEEQYELELPLTRLKDVTALEVTASGQALPEPVALRDLPDTDIYDAIAFWEPLEGMRVSLQNARVIAPTTQFGDFAVLTEADAVPGSGYFPETGVLIMNSLGGDRVDYNPERILIGASSLDEPIVVRLGDRIAALTGVVDPGYRYYKVQPATFDVEHQEPVEGDGPLSTRDGPPGDFKVVTYNLRDLFDTVDNPDRDDERFDVGSGRSGAPSAEEFETRLKKHTLAILREMELPDVIVVNENESQEVVQMIGDRVNAEAGTEYRARSLETSDFRGLEVGFLYDAARVELVDSYQMSGPEVEAVFTRASEWLNVRAREPTREPLVGVFRILPGGPLLTIIANKFKTKRFEPPLLNVYFPTPIRNTEPLRRAQSRVVRAHVNSILDKDPNALVIVTGDLGDFPFAEPGEGDHLISILEGGEGEVPMKNLISLEDEAEAYTWFFFGNGQALTHMLVSQALLKRCVAVDLLHFNSPFPDLDLRWDPSTPIRASDRDPLEARFNLRSGS